MKKLYIILGTVVLCCGFLAVGISGITINNKQYQRNDQSQKTMVKTETKVVTINDMNSGRIRDNITWKHEVFSDFSYSNFVKTFDDLDIWQQKLTKVFASKYKYELFYPIIQSHTNIIKSVTKVTNDVHTINSNEMKVETSWFKFWK